MTQGSTRVIRLQGHLHVAGECCQHWKCIWCSGRLHVQAVVENDVAIGVVEKCESCHSDEFWLPVNGARYTK